MLQRTKAWRKQMLAGALAVWMLLCAIPQPILAAVGDAFSAATTAVQNVSAATQAAAENAYKGKTISILGASISTYTGISNNAAYNSTISNNAIYYTEGRFGIYANDTWWMQVANDLGLRLLVNNSWSGSSLLYERNGTVGAYVDRCVQLHNNEGEDPDIIGIQMGTNDFQYYKDTLGTADIDYAALITENEDGSFTYATPVTSLEAAAIVLHKISIRYPNAEVYYLNISQRVDGTDELIRSFNAELKQVVEHFGAHIVDIYGSAITMADFDTYIGDGRVHPNRLGMDAYTEAFKRALLANTAYEVDTHTVSLNLDGVTADYGDDKIVVSGDAFSCTLTPEDGKELSVSVSMGSENITGTAYKNGMVSIESVTADVIISAKATVHKPQNYRWEFDGTDLVCVRGGNPLTKDTGTTTNGVFSKTSYTLKNEVVLLHNLPWTVEWKCEGTFLNTNGSSGARIFTSDNVNANYNARYIFKSNTNGIVAMGEKTTSGSHNYGIALADYGIDWTALHTYHLENRIAADGSNMVWLFVDGEEVGPMNHYYVGTTDKNTTSDWLSGKDFVFPYMGTDTHGFTNASIDYIQVTECIHTYEDGVCTGCGNVASSLSDKTISILGDSISTYAEVSNNTSYNSTIGKNSIYYNAGALGGQQHTWWQQTIDALGMRLLVNNSWSGSTVLKPRQGSGSEGYLSRCVNLHNDKTGETPDVIAVFLGTNDFSYYQSSLGTADIDYNALITDNGDGTYIYATPTTTCEAYAIMLHKMQQRYPDAEIYCMTLLPRREPDHDGKDVVPAPTAFNGELAKVIAHFGCTVVDLEHCGITSQPENFDYYISDKRVHPGAAGMDKMSEALISAMLGQTITLQHVSGQYTGTNSDNSSAVALPGAAYTANLTVQPGYEALRVTVTMGGEDITKTAYANGRIHIPTVTGEIVITAKAVKPATDYRWEFADSSVSSVTTGGNKANALTLLGGSVTGGVLQGAYFRMAEQVTLYHHRPWVIEWSAAGGWSGMLLSKLQSSSASGNEYFFKSNSVSIGLIAFGRWENGQYMNYGIRLADHGVDTAARHIYRLENRIAKDGSNAVHLLVDGVDYGAVTRHYIGTSDQGSSANWANGQDLTFGYIGANGHTLNGCDLDYLQVWEGGDTHSHAYTPVITAPTCTEQGYTTYICACGDSYVADYVDELGHYHSTADTLASGESLVLTELNIVKHNNSFLFSADVGDLGDGSIWISHGKSAYSGSYLEIKKDKVIVYSIGTTVTSKEYSHGLTITGTVIVRIDYIRSSAKLTITTESGTFIQYIGFGCNGEIACGADGVTLRNVDFRWFSSGIESNNWFFGDSWFSTTSAARWTKYLLDDGYTDILLGGYGGMGADKGLIQFRELLQFHTPEYAIWALGMNNGDRNGQINASWLRNTKEFLALCTEYGVTPILCTIPTTPKVNNRLKNEWIKESGYRYIDFDLALVEDHITGTWFEGTAASDLNHPTEAGALMLYPQVFADFPELAKADPATCNHSLKLLGSRAAECVYGGREAYYVCTLCGSAYKDAEASIRTTTAEMLTPELGHSFTAYISDGNATLYADGTKTALCDRGCGAKDTVADPGSMLFPEQVTSKVYDISGNTLGKVPAGTTVETLLSGLDWGKYCKVFGASGQVSGTELVGTGMVLKLMDGEVVKQELTIVVIGDTSSDGLITVTDFMQLKAHLLQKQILTGAAVKAADLSGDGAITITDFVQVKALLLQTAA